MLATISDDDRKHVGELAEAYTGRQAPARQFLSRTRQAFIRGTLAGDPEWIDDLEEFRDDTAMNLVRFTDTRWRGWASHQTIADMIRLEAEASQMLIGCGRGREIWHPRRKSA